MVELDIEPLIEGHLCPGRELSCNGFRIRESLRERRACDIAENIKVDSADVRLCRTLTMNCPDWADDAVKTRSSRSDILKVSMHSSLERGL